jgi:hypothetical protein
LPPVRDEALDAPAACVPAPETAPFAPFDADVDDCPFVSDELDVLGFPGRSHAMSTIASTVSMNGW